MANDHDIAQLCAKTLPMNLIWSAHLQTKVIPTNLIWSESTQWLLSSGICKISGTLIMPMDLPLWPDGPPITMTLHSYRPRRSQWIWFWVNPPSGCWVTANFGGQKDRPVAENGGQNRGAYLLTLKEGVPLYLEGIGPLVTEFRCP